MTTPTSTPDDAATAEPTGQAATDVTVAVDGTEAGLRAVRWAAHEAALRGVTLTVLHAAPYSIGSTGSLRAHADRILARAFTVAVRAEPGLHARTLLVEEDPRAALVDASRRTGLLVVGLAGREVPEDGLVGSLALDAAAAVDGPLVVVSHRMPSTGAVVAAVRDAVTDSPTILAAREAAQRYGATLEVVHATRSPHEGTDTRDAIERLLQRWADRGATVPATVHVVRGHVVETLAARTREARLLVVGPPDRRRHLRGSVSRAAIRTAGCPVLVAAAPTHR
jgi:nucleotide-binding universal stress UspA family protein